MRATHRLSLLALTLLLAFACGDHRAARAQSGRNTAAASTERDVLLNVVASRDDGSNAFVTAKDVALYDGGVEQAVKSFSPDPGPARIVLLVDNSLSLRADVDKLTEAVREFAYEIYEGDQLMIVGYDEQAEIVSDWTDDAKKIEASLAGLRKRGEPHLFDALRAVMDEALRPFSASNRKRAVVIVGDGLDRGSKTTFKQVLEDLQAQDIAVYAVQIVDRTGGAFRRDRPKPSQAIQQLTEGTGGRAFSIKEAHEAAKSICDELRKNRYVLGYTPTSYGLTEARRLLLLASDGIQIRTKTMIR